MSLKPEPIDPVPAQTVRVVRAAFPKGTTYMKMRDEIGTIWEDRDFAGLFPVRGQPALAPWRLALVTVMQFAEDLTDRQAATAVKARIDWKYALSLELTDPGFDFSVLSEFRSRLVEGGAEQLLLDKMLERFGERGWVKARGRQRTDSTHILANVRTINRLECVGETLRAALNVLAVAAPDWLRARADDEWFKRYGRQVEDYRIPKGAASRQEWAETVGTDGSKLLRHIDEEQELTWLSEVPAIQQLRATWKNQYDLEADKIRLRDPKDLPPSGERADSPYDTDARFGNKLSVTWTSYKLHLTETCGENEPHLITRVETTQAHVADVNQTQKVHNDLDGRRLLPDEHIADAGFVDGELLLRSRTEHGVNLIGPLRQDNGWQAKMEGAYDVTRFQVDWEAKKVTCPEGQTSTSWTPFADKWGNQKIRAKFPTQVCQACESRSLCTQAKHQPRSVTLRPSKEEHELVHSVRSQQYTPEWKDVYDNRAGIEGTFSQANSVTGLRRARYRGIDKVGLEHVVTAAALNVLRMVEWLRGTPHAQPRSSAFALLAAA